MKRVEVVRAKEVEVKPLDLRRYTLEHIKSKTLKSVAKKELKEMAEAMGLAYDDDKISFAKKLMNAYIKKEAL